MLAEIIGLGAQLEMHYQTTRDEIQDLRAEIQGLSERLGGFDSMEERLRSDIIVWGGGGSGSDSGTQLPPANRLTWGGAVTAVVVGTLLVRYGPEIIASVVALLALLASTCLHR